MADLVAAHDLEVRSAQIGERLTQHLDDVGVQPVRYGLEEWNQERDQYGAFGYSRPKWQTTFCVIRFCPERIAQTTEWLNEFDLEEYLAAVEVQLDYYVAHYAMEDEAASQWFDRFIAANAPGSQKLMVEVQSRWLRQR